MDVRDYASPKEVANYLLAIKPLVARAIEVRQSWIRELGLLFVEAQAGNTANVTTRAGRLGREHVNSFRDVRTAIERSRAPAVCGDIREAALTWMDGLVRACEALIEVGNSGSMAAMQNAQRHVTDARHAARNFNAEYGRLVGDLKSAMKPSRRR